jgi:hypothetical protein
LLLILLLAGSAFPAATDADPKPASETLGLLEEEQMRPGWLPVAGALMPGILIHGTGHFLGGDSETGWKLLAIESAGLLAIGAGGTPIVLLGASPKAMVWALPLTLAGVGLFAISGSADLYGSIAGGDGLGLPARSEAFLTADLGYTYVHDPQFSYTSFAQAQVTGRLHGARLSVLSQTALDDDNQRLREELSYRFFGPRTTPAARSLDGSFLELTLATTWHRYGTEGFSVLSGEASLLGRCDMAALSDSLAGSFAEMGLGWGLEFYRYGAAGLGWGEDAADMLLMRFAYGLYLGQAGERWGELMFFYDHRHDDFAAGLSFGSKGDGVAGHVGLAGFFQLTPSWGLSASLEVGSAWVASLSARFRYGETQ